MCSVVGQQRVDKGPPQESVACVVHTLGPLQFAKIQKLIVQTGSSEILMSTLQVIMQMQVDLLYYPVWELTPVVISFSHNLHGEIGMSSA